MNDLDTSDELVVERLQAKVDQLRESTCETCGQPFCGHAALFSIALGLGAAPRCASCLAAGMETTVTQLRDHLVDHFQRRACYGEVWRRESQREGFGEASQPACLWTRELPDNAATAVATSAASQSPIEPLDAELAALTVAEEWDAGDMSCGDLVLALRSRLQKMAPGSTFKLLARDSGAKEDIPSWCRMTGHTLLTQQHPAYWIRRKD